MTTPESFIETLEANVNNKDLSDKEFRDFVKRSLKVVTVTKGLKEYLGISEETDYKHTVSICVDKDEQDSIWDIFSDAGRKRRGMKKVKVFIKEESNERSNL